MSPGCDPVLDVKPKTKFAKKTKERRRSDYRMRDWWTTEGNSPVQVPFNAEPPRSALITSYVTPVEYFYKRNHGPIVNDIERYNVSITCVIGNSKELFMKDIQKLPKYSIDATLQMGVNIMPFQDNNLDAVYAIEATCHARDAVLKIR